MDTIPTCRVCLKTSLSYIDLETLFENEDTNIPMDAGRNVLITYMDCFRSCTHLKPSDRETEMPQNLCEQCAFELGVAWNFIQRATQSDKVLKNALVKVMPYTEPILLDNGKCHIDIEVEDINESYRSDEEIKKEASKEIGNNLNVYSTVHNLQNRDSDYFVNMEDHLNTTSNSDISQSIVNEERSTNSSVQSISSPNKIEAEEYYIVELIDIAENSEHKTDSDPTEFGNDVDENATEDNDANVTTSNEIKDSSSEYYCSTCFHSFESQRELLMHSRSHMAININVNTCKICNHEVTKEETLRRHIKSTHSASIQCSYCDHRCQEYKMQDHVHRTHAEPKNFVCSICEKTFVSQSILSSHLKYHQRKEANTKSDACEICGKRFSTKHYLRLHMEVHRIERQLHQCNHCDKIYVSKIALDNHIRLHKGETIKCNECGKEFVRQYELNVHMRFHTRDYPFKCEVCGKNFAIKGHLRTHMWRHQGLKLQCEECGKLFTSTKALQEHSFVHSEMPFPCSYCGRGYPSKQKFKVHLKTTHLIEFTDEEILKVTKSQTPKPLQRKKLTLVQADSVMKEVEVKDSCGEAIHDGEEMFVELS
ncbi:zinc finger protein 175 [Ceratitis capitata]|uniref:Zinc finger protein 782 n=1 Tax=Ceratitis capitata TaxID=7213 RepID=W8C898_CERCA|nr:zinc finger protein 175 [Ceratitis capitata]